jgi:predicted secreted protein
VSRRVPLALAAGLAASPVTALAGDFADRAILGFSPDGAVFAFEEFGVQDGSGFAYSNIYLIDTVKDAWVSGTPIRVMHESEEETLANVREEARQRAEPWMSHHDVAPRGRVVVSNPSSELSADPYKVRFLTDLYANWPNHDWTLTLTPVPLPEPIGCENLGPVQGFRLVLTNWLEETWTIHDDAALPASRGCVQDYAIADVVTYIPNDRIDGVMVVLLHVISQGFEGPDRRFLAVATQFQDR